MRWNKCFLAAFVVLTCAHTVAATEQVQMTMTTRKVGEVSIGLGGSGTATIDWGNGTDVETITLSANNIYEFIHNYSDTIVRNISITGKNITALQCNWNHLISLDLSSNTALKELECSYNQLTSLDLSRNTALTIVQCSHNLLTNLDVSNNIELTGLYFNNNQLTSLDVSNNIELTGLFCGINQLTGLDIRRNIKLDTLGCSDNKLTKLDVSNSSVLEYLYCDNNQLTILDVSKNSALIWFSCSNNQLTDLDVSRSIELMTLFCRNNQLSTTSLNALFATLHSNCISGFEKSIYIGNNPGTNTCNPSIATSKGWNIYTEEEEEFVLY